jgi:hypothetical protein
LPRFAEFIFCFIFVDFVRFSAYNGFIHIAFARWEDFMTLLSVAQTAKRWGISPRRIQILCSEGRIPSAMRIGHAWVIPDHASKPDDARIKSGKYRKAVNAEKAEKE